MSALTIQVEVTAGTSVERAAQEAVGLADRLQIEVQYIFNGVTCLVFPGGNPERLAARCREQIRKGDESPFATSD